jgi:hypothetical protein
MKDFAGSSITYYGLAREKLMEKYPRLVSVLVILALICMTGLAIFLISDLVSYASNQDHKGALTSLDLNGPQKGIVPMTQGNEKSGNISANSSRTLENSSRITMEQSLANLSKANASLSSSREPSAVVAASKSSSGKSSVIKHHSSSSSSSSSSSAKSGAKSNDKNNLTNLTATSLTPINQSMNSSLRSNDSEVTLNATPVSLPLTAAGSITNPARNTPAREPVSIIKFKTNGASVSDSNKAPSSISAKKRPNSRAIRANSASAQASKVTPPSQVKKAQDARAKIKANRDRIAENLKKRAAQSRARAA